MTDTKINSGDDGSRLHNCVKTHGKDENRAYRGSHYTKNVATLLTIDLT